MASNLIQQINGSNVAPTNIGNNCQYNFIIQFDVTSGELIGVVTDGPEIMQNEDTLHFFSESLAIAVAKTGSVVSVGLEIVPSSDVGNTAVIGTDGRIYVPAGGGGGLADQDTILGTGVLGDEYTVNFVDNGDGTYNIGVNIIDTNVSLVVDLTLVGDGTSGNPLGVRISADVGNSLTTGADGGLFVPAASGSVVTVDDTNSIDLSITGDGSIGTPYEITGDVIIDPAATNLSSVTASGLLTEIDTDLTLTGDGTGASPLGVAISADVDNQLTTGSDGGLYVPDPGGGVSLTTNDAARATLVGTVLNIPDSTPFARIVFQNRVARRATAVAQVGVGNEGNAITTYAWTGAGVTFGTPAAATTTISVAAPGTYTLQLVVTDSNSNTYTTTRVFTAEDVVYINSDDSEYLVIDQLSTAWTQLTNQGISGGTIKTNGTSTMTANFSPDDVVYVEGGRHVGSGGLRSILAGNGSPIYFRNTEIAGNVVLNFDAGGDVDLDSVIWNTSGGSDGFLKGGAGTASLSVKHSSVNCSRFMEDLAGSGNNNLTIEHTTIVSGIGIESASGSLLSLSVINSNITVTSGAVIETQNGTVILYHSKVETEGIASAITFAIGTTVALNAFHSEIISADGNAVNFGTSTTPDMVARYCSFVDRTGTQSIGRGVGLLFSPGDIYKCLFLGPVAADFVVPGAQDNLVA